MSEKFKARDKAQKEKKEKKEAAKRLKKGIKPHVEEKPVEERVPFALKDISLQIPRGDLFLNGFPVCC